MDRTKLEQVSQLTRSYNFSENAYNCLMETISNTLENDGVEDFSEAIWEQISDEFSWYDDAWDYMKNYGDNELDDPVRNGFTRIDQIAGYNLEQEIYELMNKFGLESSDFER